MDDKGEYSVEVQDTKPKHSKCNVKVIGMTECEYKKCLLSTTFILNLLILHLNRFRSFFYRESG